MVTKRKIIKKVITPAVRGKVEVKEEKLAVPTEVSESQVESVREQSSDGYSKHARAKKVCSFCQNKTIPSYTDLSILRRFLTDRAKIVAKERSGVCAKHQRGVAKNIKYARHLALLPFVPKI